MEILHKDKAGPPSAGAANYIGDGLAYPALARRVVHGIVQRQKVIGLRQP